ncbi:MAG: VWA domain-containing protein [Phycisphaerales bacterium]
MSVTFEHPAWLLLILLAIPIAWAGLRWFSSMSRARRLSAVLLRVTVIALVSAMLAGASSIRRTDRIAVIGVVDVSSSVRMFAALGPDADGKPRDPLRLAQDLFARAALDRGPDDLLGLVVFDGRSLAVAAPTRGDIADRTLDFRMAEGTDIASALRYAAALIPPGASGRLVLISDGNQTAGDALSAARELVGAASAAGDTPPGAQAAAPGRIPIDVVPVPLSAAREVMVEALDAPPRAAAESTISVRVTLRSTVAAAGSLTLTREGEPLDINGAEPGFARRITLQPGSTVELIQVPLPPGKIHRFAAVFEPDSSGPGAGADTRLENNRAEAFTVSPGKGAILIADGVGNALPGPGLTLPETLRRAGMDVTVIPAEGIPSSILALEAYDLVILQNVPVESVPPPTQEALAAYVRDLGGGLVMVGGPDSFGAGGWKGSALEPILPVRLDLPEQLIQPDAAIVFVIDNSGSMGRAVFGSVRSQQEIANESTAMAIRTLDRKDLVGVITFNSMTSVLVPLGPNTDPKAISERVLSIGPGGGTILGPALAEARLQLRGARAAVKHVIVLSDGRSMGADSLPAKAEKMKAEDGITVSTIGVGDEMDSGTMGQMAQRGGGQFYPVTNPALLPRFFLKAIRVVRTPLVREGMFQPVLLPSASPLTAGLETPPPLGGLVLTQRRPEPTITYAMAAPTGEPLLAHWSVELGRVTAFTSDAHTWARPWLDSGWPGYDQLWTQIARGTSRAGAPGRFELASNVESDTLRLRLEASADDGRPLDLLVVPATVYTPSGRTLETTLTQTGPGLYEGSAPATESGNYLAILKPRLGQQRLAPVIGGASLAAGIEFRSLTTNTALLRSLASETGGRVHDLFGPGAVGQTANLAGLFDRSTLPPSTARTPLWGPLLLWTILILLLDIATRRIAWDRFISREYGVDLRQAAAEAVRQRGHEAAATISRLRARDEQVEAAAAPAAGAALSEDAAVQVIEAERERRRQARMAAAKVAQVQDELAVPAPTLRPAPEPDSRPDADGLLAAKRRARERFTDGEVPPP